MLVANEELALGILVQKAPVICVFEKMQRSERILGAQENLPRSLLDANEGEIYRSATPKMPLICVF